MKYLVVIEPTGTGYSAYSPDLPGCIATGGSTAEVEHEMREAIAFQIDGLKIESCPVRVPATRSAYLDIDVAA